MADFIMPSLGADMDAGILAEWKVKVGDRVKRGDIIAEVETQKGVIEIEVFEDGIISAIKIQPGEEVPVGTVLAVIENEGKIPTQNVQAPPASAIEEVPSPTKVIKEAGSASDSRKTVSEKNPEEQPKPHGESGSPGLIHIKATPLARKIAEERGLDLSKITGSGEDGVILRQDVENYAPEETLTPAITPATSVTEIKKEIPQAPKDPVGSMRKAIAAAMSKSNREIPLYYLITHIDMKKSLEWLGTENKKRAMKDRLLQPVLIIKAMAKALEEVPQLNGFWKEDTFEPATTINIGIVISLRQGGIVVPAIQDVQSKSLDQIMQEMTDMTIRSREGKLKSSELTSGTVTLTNLGDRGAEAIFGIIYPPQVAILGAGKIIEQPWAENGMLDVRPVLTLTLAGDHRATDGHTGSRFLEAINNHLQQPASL